MTGEKGSKIDCVKHDHMFVTITKIDGSFCAVWTNRGKLKTGQEIVDSVRFKDIKIFKAKARREWARKKSQEILESLMSMRSGHPRTVPLPKKRKRPHKSKSYQGGLFS